MRKLFAIPDTVANKISYYHLVCFLMALPFDFFYSEIVLISFGIHTLLHVTKKSWKRIVDKRVLIPISVYLLGAVAILYSPDKPEAFNIAGRQLAILLFPLLFALSDLDLQKYKQALICIFGFTCVLSVLYLYADAIRTILYFNLPLSSLFSNMFLNHNFSLPIQMHATYMSAYVAFSLLAFLYMLVRKEQPGAQVVYIIAILILFTGLLQLSSRSVFIAFMLIANLAFPVMLFKGKKRLFVLVIASFVSASVFLFIFNVDAFRTRYISELKTDLTHQVKIIDNTEPRLARWDAIMELVERSPLTGFGTGSEKKLLQDKYFEKGLYNSYLHEFNTHSEYLSILLKMGLVGLALFIYVLYFGLASAIRRKDVLFMGFMLLIVVVSFSENILDLNKGIFFYSFFFSLFLRATNGPPAKNPLGVMKATYNNNIPIKNKVKDVSDACPVNSYNHVQ